MRRHLNKGFSLVELMVALALGTLIVAAAVQMFITNQRTFQLQQTMTDVQETGRFAASFISTDLRKAGLSLADGTAPGGVLTDVDLASGTLEGGTAATDNDQLRFQFYGTKDCEGDEYGAAPNLTLIENRYSVDGSGNLQCVGLIDEDGDGTLEADTTPVTLVSNVDSFQVLYGVDRAMTSTTPQQDGIPFAGRYLRADEVTSSDEVVSVRVGLLVRAERDSTQQSGTPKGFTVLDKVLSGGSAPLDTHALRRLFINTVKLRNFTWDAV